MTTYTPQPVDTSDVEVTSDILAVAEELAKNTHDVWAQGRIIDGWVYGEVRDNEKLVHPCLVPYDKLPEHEKEYDRRTSIETLKLLIKLGYSITKSEVQNAT